jgi:lipopolysaccharide/colanic/teichoic acid biosynthesis glycosyltransferase
LITEKYGKVIKGLGGLYDVRVDTDEGSSIYTCRAKGVLHKDEEKLLSNARDADKTYIEEIVPAKMRYNLQAVREFRFFGDIKLMFMTVFAVLGKEYAPKEETPAGK